MHLEKFSLNFSSSLFAIRVNLLHYNHACFYEVYYSFWCFSILVNYHFQVPFSLFKVILYMAIITQNALTDLL